MTDTPETQGQEQPEANQSQQGGSAEKPSRPKHIGIREKIRAGVILERIERHALGELDPPMDNSQLKAAEIALKKCIPDLQSIQLTGDADNPVRLIGRLENVIVDPNPSA